MNDRLKTSKKEYEEELEADGFKIGVDSANNDLSYSDLRKLQRADEVSTVEGIQELEGALERCWDEIFEEDETRTDDSSFIAAFVRGALSVLDDEESPGGDAEVPA